jgi:hypothetical protein
MVNSLQNRKLFVFLTLSLVLVLLAGCQGKPAAETQCTF